MPLTMSPPLKKSTRLNILMIHTTVHNNNTEFVWGGVVEKTKELDHIFGVD